jgi:CheY-like chemotaxis protein
MTLPTVLLAEDNPDDVVLVRRAWQRSGIAVSLQVVGDGEAALRYLRGEGPYADRAAYPPPDLVLLDWKLPRLMGREVLRTIRAEPRHDDLPVIVLTASREDEDVLDAYAARANSYLQKPVSAGRLTALLGSLGRYWLEHNVRAVGLAAPGARG